MTAFRANATRVNIEGGVHITYQVAGDVIADVGLGHGADVVILTVHVQHGVADVVEVLVHIAVVFLPREDKEVCGGNRVCEFARGKFSPCGTMQNDSITRKVQVCEHLQITSSRIVAPGSNHRPRHGLMWREKAKTSARDPSVHAPLRAQTPPHPHAQEWNITADSNIAKERIARTFFKQTYLARVSSVIGHFLLSPKYSSSQVKSLPSYDIHRRLTNPYIAMAALNSCVIQLARIVMYPPYDPPQMPTCFARLRIVSDSLPDKSCPCGHSLQRKESPSSKPSMCPPPAMKESARSANAPARPLCR